MTLEKISPPTTDGETVNLSKTSENLAIKRQYIQLYWLVTCFIYDLRKLPVWVHFIKLRVFHHSFFFFDCFFFLFRIATVCYNIFQLQLFNRHFFQLGKNDIVTNSQVALISQTHWLVPLYCSYSLQKASVYKGLNVPELIRRKKSWIAWANDKVPDNNLLKSIPSDGIMTNVFSCILPEGL